MATKTPPLHLVWDVMSAEMEVLCSIEEGTVTQELRDYVLEGETRRAYVRCTPRAPPTWMYPPLTFPEPRLIGTTGIAINLVFRTGPEWRVGIYKKIGEVVFERDPLRRPMAVEKIVDQIIASAGINARREEIINGVRRVLCAAMKGAPYVYPEEMEEE